MQLNSLGHQTEGLGGKTPWSSFYSKLQDWTHPVKWFTWFWFSFPSAGVRLKKKKVIQYPNSKLIIFKTLAESGAFLTLELGYQCICGVQKKTSAETSPFKLCNHGCCPKSGGRFPSRFHRRSTHKDPHSQALLSNAQCPFNSKHLR